MKNKEEWANDVLFYLMVGSIIFAIGAWFYGICY